MQRRDFFRRFVAGLVGVFGFRLNISQAETIKRVAAPLRLPPKSHTIRLWKLGSLDPCILPSESAVCRLAKMLEQLREMPGGTVDLIWGPELNVEVVEVDADQLQVVASADIEVRQDGKMLRITHKTSTPENV